jgi:hypothetical protein
MTRLERAALIAAGIGLLGSIAGGALSGADAFCQSYLVGVIFWVQIAFGCLGIQMLHGLTGGGWGLAARRPLHVASSTMPLLAVLFVPLFFSLPRIYPWARPEVVAHDELLQHKAAFLNVPFFAARTIGYFVLWSAIALLLFQRQRGKKPNTGPGRTARTLAGPGILACGVTMTFAAIDWLMSLDPHWSSTMFGLLVIVGSLLSGIAFCIVFVTTFRDEEAVSIDRLHDLGRLLLVFVMLWAYLSFSQYLIIYGANLAEEVPFYVHRQEGGWQQIALALIVLHFGVPFVVLLTRRTKRSPRALRAVAIGILAMRLVEIFWIAAPTFRGHHFEVRILDISAPVLLGGLWLFWFLRRLSAFAGAARNKAAPAEHTS